MPSEQPRKQSLMGRSICVRNLTKGLARWIDPWVRLALFVVAG